MSAFDYTADRHTALHLVRREEICSVDAVVRRCDGRDLDPGVFASLLALRGEGYIEQQGIVPEDAAAASRPLRLGLRGVQLLAELNHEHARRQRPHFTKRAKARAGRAPGGSS